MCLIVLAWQCVPGHPLVLAANRDEQIARPAHPAAPWPETPHILAGRDAVAGGTWLAAAPDGRFAAVTNFHLPGAGAGARSRGALPADFLRGGQGAADYARAVTASAGDYAPFTLLVGDTRALWCVGHGDAPVALAPGIHVLGNGPLDAGGPRADHARARLAAALHAPARHVRALLDALGDPAPPASGGPMAALRLQLGGYGTRSSAVLVRTDAGAVHFAEHTHLPEPAGPLFFIAQPAENTWQASGVPA